MMAPAKRVLDAIMRDRHSADPIKSLTPSKMDTLFERMKVEDFVEKEKKKAGRPPADKLGESSVHLLSPSPPIHVILTVPPSPHLPMFALNCNRSFEHNEQCVQTSGAIGHGDRRCRAEVRPPQVPRF